MLDIKDKESFDEIRALKEKAEHLNSIMENSTDVIYLVEVAIDGRFIHRDVNKAYLEVSGLKKEDVLGIYVDEFENKEYRDILTEKYSLCLKAKEKIDYIKEYNFPKGKRTFHSTLSPIFDKNGRVSQIIGIARDITRTNQTKYEHTLLKFAYDHSHEGAFLFDESGNFKYVNQAYCKIQGYTSDELMNMSVFNVDTELRQEQWEQFWQELKEAGTLNFERTNTTHDGKIYPIEVNANYFEYEGKGYNIGSLRDITERKALQDKIKKRQQEFRSLANNIPDNIARWDTEGRYIFANDSLQKTLGKTYQEMLGKRSGELFPNGEFEEVEKYIKQVIKTQKSCNLYKLEYLNSDGKTIYDDLSFTPEFDDEGNFISILSVGKNMTEYYMMQDKISKQEELYRLLAESMPANIALWDNETRHLYVNERLRNNTFKVAQETYMGKTINEAFPNGEYEGIKNLVLQVIDTKQPSLFQRIPGSDTQEDESLFYDLHLIPYFDTQNKVTSVLGVGIDMSEHYRMQEEIESKEEQLRNTVETIPGVVGIFHLKPDNSSNIPYISPNAKELLGYGANTLMKSTKRVASLIHPKDFRSVQKEMMRSYKNKSAWRQEFRVIHPRKKERWLEVNAKPMPHLEGGMTWFGYIHDISERKKYEQQIGLASIGQLSAGITHEINTPLTYVKGRLELMRYSIEDMDECHAKNDILFDIGSIEDGVSRMSHIIDSMREIAGKSKNDKETVDIYNSFITILVMIHNKSKYIASIYLNEELFTLSLSNSGQLFNAFVEKQRIEQVFIIILNNALDALDQKRRFEENHIWINIFQKANKIIITIEDNAGGIVEELLPIIFEPFTSTKEHGGMGLGLNIAKKIIDEQNGTIEVTNSQKGAYITITLPKI